MQTIKKRKGFTLTELAIVIAVIAILIAVLVPTFVSLLNKAGDSADEQMIYNVNNALSIENASNSIDTPEEALSVAADAGYNIEAFSPYSDGNVIIYDEKSVSFALVTEEGELVYGKSGVDYDMDAPTTWYIVDEATYNSYNTTADGNNYQVAKTSVKPAKAGVVNGEGHTVSYILKGDWNSSTVDYTGMGGIYTKKASGITKVNYTIKTVTNTKDYELNMTYGVSNEVETVETKIDDNTLTSYVIQKSCGSNTVTTVTTTVTTNISVTFETEEEDTSPVLYDTSSTTITVTVTQNGTDVTEEVTADSSTTITRSDNGTLELGTKNYPYLIASADDLSKITSLSTKMNSGEYYYFELTDDITISNSSYNSYDGDNYVIQYFCGQLDGNDHNIIVSDNDGNASKWYGLIAYLPGDATFVDINIQVPTTGRFNLVGNYYNVADGRKAGTVIFDNVDTYNRESSSVLYNNSGLLMTNSYAKTLVVKNCDNYAAMTGNENSSGAIWIGQFMFESEATITFENCNNYADISGKVVGMFMANAEYYKDSSGQNYAYATISENSLSVTNCYNYGLILGVGDKGSASLFGSGSTGKSFSVFDQYSVSDINATSKEYKTTGQIAKVSKTTDGLTYDTSSNLVVNLTNEENATYVLTFKAEVWTATRSSHTTRTLSFSVTTGTTSYKNAVLIDLVTFNTKYSTADIDSTAAYDNNGVVYYTYTDATSGTIYYIIDGGTDASGNSLLVDDSTLTTTVYAYDQYGTLTAYATL